MSDPGVVADVVRVPVTTSDGFDTLVVIQRTMNGVVATGSLAETIEFRTGYRPPGDYRFESPRFRHSTTAVLHHVELIGEGEFGAAVDSIEALFIEGEYVVQASYAGNVSAEKLTFDAFMSSYLLIREAPEVTASADTETELAAAAEAVAATDTALKLEVTEVVDVEDPSHE